MFISGQVSDVLVWHIIVYRWIVSQYNFTRKNFGTNQNQGEFLDNNVLNVKKMGQVYATKKNVN